MVRVSYDNGPALALWWLDGYLDLDDAQEAAARPLLREWFAWHRATQLPQYARWLATWRERAAGEVNADEVCRWSAQTREALWTATERALPAGAQLLPTLKPAQLDHLAAEMADKLADERRKRAQPSAEDRRAAALERAIDSAEELYGTITDAQQRLLADAVARSPMDAVRWLDDRERRQRRFIDDLRRARVLADEATRLAALRAVGVPYSDAMIENAERDALGQARPDSDDAEGVAERYGEATQLRRFGGKAGPVTEMDALVAFLQVLGKLTDVAARMESAAIGADMDADMEAAQ